MSSTGRPAGHGAGADCPSIPALRTITVTARRTYTLQLYRAGGLSFRAVYERMGNSIHDSSRASVRETSVRARRERLGYCQP